MRSDRTTNSSLLPDCSAVPMLPLPDGCPSARKSPSDGRHQGSECGRHRRRRAGKAWRSRRSSSKTSRKRSNSYILVLDGDSAELIPASDVAGLGNLCDGRSPAGTFWRGRHRYMHRAGRRISDDGRRHLHDRENAISAAIMPRAAVSGRSWEARG